MKIACLFANKRFLLKSALLLTSALLVIIILEVDLRAKENEHLAEQNERDKFWKILVKRYWELTQNTSSAEDIGFSNLTDYFIQRPEFNLWGTNALNSSEPQVQTGFTEADRIIPQTILALEGHQHPAFKNAKKKLIHVSGPPKWFIDGSLTPSVEECPGWNSKCEYVTKNSTAAAVLASTRFKLPEVVADNIKRFYFILEPPHHTNAILTRTNDLMSTFWSESDVVVPYAKWVYYNPEVKQRPQSQGTNNTQAKTKMAAIFVSNCRAKGRLKYVAELQKYIQVDVFGRCGKNVCSRERENTCFEMLSKEYYFYLAFENSNCRDYITEKFFKNALQNNVVPVVMGGHPDDYRASAPMGSYLHVDHYSSPKELAETMISIASNPEVYQSFFNWKGTGELLSIKDTMYFCRVCAMLHYADVVPPPTRAEFFLWNHYNSRLCIAPGPGSSSWEKRKD